MPQRIAVARTPSGVLIATSLSHGRLSVGHVAIDGRGARAGGVREVGATYPDLVALAVRGEVAALVHGQVLDGPLQLSSRGSISPGARPAGR